MDQIIAQQVRRKSQKNKLKNTPCAETVTGAAMLALLNTTNAVRHARSMAVGALPPHIVGRGHDQQATEVRREGEDKEGRGRQQQGRTTTTVPFLKQSSGNEKA
jgi:hypothetical protein